MWRTPPAVTDNADRQRALLDAAYAAHNAGAPTSEVLDRCIRLARARGDWMNVWILTNEAIDHNARRTVEYLKLEIIGAIGQETYDKFRSTVGEDWIERRSWDDGSGAEAKVHPSSVAQIEEHIAYLERVQDRLSPPAAPGFEEELRAHQEMVVNAERQILASREILRRVRQHCHTFLVRTEAALGVSDTASDTFSRVRQHVDARLAEVAPAALQEFGAAYERAGTDDTATLSQALLSCRRVIKALADALYPATGATITGADGRDREMTDDKFINRLVQFAVERIPSATSRRLALSSLEELGRRLDATQDLASRGVHDEVTQVEADQCIVQTYLLAADFLSLPPGPPVGM